MDDKYDFEERISICIESGISQQKSEEMAARQFFKSCNLPTAQDKEDARKLGWSKLKIFRTMNQEGLKQWRETTLSNDANV